MRLKQLIPFLPVLALLPLASVLGGRETAVVLTVASGPYKEAFSAFQEEFGNTVLSYDLSVSAAIPREKVIVAFGGKAATRDYPAASLLVYCMAPGMIDHPARHGRTVAVSMVPDAGQALRTLLRIQPGLRRLAVFHTSDAYGRYLEALRAEGKRLNIKILPTEIRSGEDVPSELRRLRQDMGAFWLLPDPLLVSSENFTILRDFSRANRIPFYAPTAGLAQKGATAAVYNSFSEIGRTAAKAAKEGARGNSDLRYPEKISYAINKTECDYIRLELTADIIAKAEAVF